MAQTTTSNLIVSLGPPRPSVSLTSTATCATSTILGVTACIGTPVCLTSPWTVVGTAITLDSNGLPFLECTNTTSGTSEPTTSGPNKPSGIASVSLHHTPMTVSIPGVFGTSSTTIASTSSSATGTSTPAPSQSTNAAGHATVPSGKFIPMLVAWLGIFAIVYPGIIL